MFILASNDQIKAKMKPQSLSRRVTSKVISHVRRPVSVRKFVFKNYIFSQLTIIVSVSLIVADPYSLLFSDEFFLVRIGQISL